MIQWFRNLFSNQDHIIDLPGLNITVCPTIKTVFMVDQTGSDDNFAMAELTVHLQKQGYFLHGVSVGVPMAEEKG